MACNNAAEAEVNVECETAMTMSLLDLNDFTLLRVFSYLNLRDSINFARTSKRLKSVGALHFTKYKQLDLLKYERSQQSNKLPAETILFHIGQHIKTLSTTSMRSTVTKAVVDNCVNVTTLELCDFDDISELKKWMQQLKLESLTIGCCSHFNELSVRLEELKELHFTDGNGGLTSMQLTNILEKTTELESLKVNMMYYPVFNYAVFTRLPKLKCLDIEIQSEDLENLTKSLKMDGLTQFICAIKNFDFEGVQRVNSFLEILAEKSKLDELRLDTESVDQNTFRILKSFHDLTSLGFYAIDYVDDTWDERWMVHQLVNAQPNLKHLEILDPDNILIEEVYFVVKNLVKLETFTFVMETEDLEQLGELRINELLKTSTSRPMLTLYRKSGYYEAPSEKIELRFEQRRHRIVQLGRNYADDSYFLTDDFTG